MPVNLDQFLNIAANRTTSEIYINGPDHQPRAETRGRFRSWIVSLFKGKDVRNQRTETAHAFIAALQEKISAKASALSTARDELKAQFDDDATEIVSSLKRLLASQLSGNKALTANDVHRANEFVESTLTLADSEKDELLASLNREEGIAHLEQAAMRFYGRENIDDINLTDAAAQVKADAAMADQEAALAARGFRVVGRAPQPPKPESLAHLLRGYLAGNPKQMNFEETYETLNKLRSDIRDIQQIYNIAEPLFERLSNGESVNPNSWTTGIEPGSEDAKAYLNALRTLKNEYLGPMKTLEFFLKADVVELKREEFLDATELKLNNGETARSERPVRAILDEFLEGKQLSEADVAFISAARGSTDLTLIERNKPGYQLYSSGGNINGSITGVLEGASQVPNHIWQVVTDQTKPDPSLVSYAPTENNPWALAIHNQLIARGDEVHEFSNAQKGLAKLMNSIVHSKGNLEVAERMEAEAPPPPKHEKHWDEKRASINNATLKNANEVFGLEKQFSPEKFVRGVNRSLNIDPNATPARPKNNSDKDYTHGYDDDVEAGRFEASNPSSPLNRPGRAIPAEGAEPRSILRSRLSPSQQTINVVNDYAHRYGFDSEFIQSYAQQKNIDLSKFSAAHQELYKTLLFHQSKAFATDFPSQFNDESIQKNCKRILDRLNTLTDVQAAASLARFSELREVGTAILASISDMQISGISNQRQPISQALINFIDKVNSHDISDDLMNRIPDEPVGQDEILMARSAAADIALSGLSPQISSQLLERALDESSPLRSAYLAVGAHDSNPTINRNNNLNTVLIQLTHGLNVLVQQIGQNAGANDAKISEYVNEFMRTFGFGRYQEFANQNRNETSSVLITQAREVYDALKTYIPQRSEFLRASPTDTNA